MEGGGIANGWVEMQRSGKVDSNVDREIIGDLERGSKRREICGE